MAISRVISLTLTSISRHVSKCSWHLYTANFRNVLLWRKDWSTEVIIPPLLAASGVVQLAGNVRDVEHVKDLQQTLCPRALERAYVLR